MNADEVEIADLVTRLYAVFGNVGGRKPPLEDLHQLFIPQGLIIKGMTTPPEIVGIDAFIAPRAKILNDGTLTDFEEWETSGETTVLGSVAHRISHYSKKGQLSGAAFEASGVKTLQFLKIDGSWKLTSLSWHDY